MRLELLIELTPISKLLKHILNNHGRKGLTQILKAVKAWAFKLLDGEKGYSHPWFKVRTYKGYAYPKRFERIFKPYIKAILKSNFTEIQRYLSYLNVYQAIEGPLGTLEEAVLPAKSEPCKSSPATEFFEHLLDLMQIYIRELAPLPGYKVRPTAKKVAITPVRNGTYSEWVAEGAPGMDKIIKAPWIIGGSAIWDVSYVPKYQGNLTLIGDSGGKDRLILVGNPVVQSRLEPLQQFLFKALKELPQDCTFDQTKGHHFVQEKQSNGERLWSVDLKDCTWHFPFSLQKHLLLLMGGQSFIKDLELPVSEKGKLFKVTKGQAMGLMPSFPLFSLTHNLVLLSICHWKGIDPDSYRVLGDDVVISNEDLYNMYRKFLTVYEVPVSSHKCLSGRAAEFAGKLFFKGKDVTPIRWRKLDRESLSSLYHHYVKVLGRGIASRLCDLTDFDVLAALPKDCGGLNIPNFDKSLPDRFTRFGSKRYRSILRLRLGIVRSLRENLGVPKPKGDTIRVDQPILSLLTASGKYDSYLLRSLASLLEAPEVENRWGKLVYLGDPKRLSQQLKVEIPLLPDPSIKRRVKPYRELLAQSTIFRWLNQKGPTTYLKVLIQEEIDEYRFAREDFKKKKKLQKESASQEMETESLRSSSIFDSRINIRK